MSSSICSPSPCRNVYGSRLSIPEKGNFRFAGWPEGARAGRESVKFAYEILDSYNNSSFPAYRGEHSANLEENKTDDKLRKNLPERVPLTRIIFEIFA